MAGHGHVTPNADGSRARCGGPGICSECSREKAALSQQRPKGASTQCPHSDLHIEINNAAFGDTNLHYFEIKARCKICDKPMAFRGAPLGCSPHHPAMSLGGDEIRLPFLAEGEELVGEPIGYTVSYSGP